MWDILKAIFDSLSGYAAPYKTQIISGIAILISALLLIRFVGAAVIRGFARRREGLTKEQFKAKGALLAHDEICELYAPSARFVRDLRDEEKNIHLAFLSPYPRAVKAAIKRTKTPKEKKLDARKQVAHAAKQITLSDIPKGEGATDGYLISFKLDGHAPDELRKHEERIKAQLGLHTLREVPSKDAYSIKFAAYVNEPEDPLVAHKVGAEFFAEHPAQTPYSMPLAVKANGKPWSLATHHTLIWGMTGSGKGSVIHGVIQQLAPFVKKGRAQLFGIDPKASELRPYAESSLFREIVYDTSESQALIAHLHGVMKKRAMSKTVDLERAELGRSLEATLETPMLVLLIDELLSLLIALKQEGRSGAATTSLLTEILAQGRSLGIYVMGATQAVDAELLGRMRGNFANKVLLRTDNKYFNDMFLGDKASERGYDSTQIPLSTKANGYAYAGIAFAQEESGDIARVRFAYCSDRDIADLCRAFPPLGTSDFLEDSATKSTGDMDEGDWGFEEVELPSLDDFN